MLVVEDRDREYFNKVCAFAFQKGAQYSEWLWDALWYLHGYADREMDGYECPKCRHVFVDGERGKMAGLTRALLYRDFAPASFGVTFQKVDRMTGLWTQWFSGGLIFHGDQSGWELPGGRVIEPGQAVDVLSVTLTRPDNPWSLHT